MTKLATSRVATGERRDQIVAATLRLLAHTSIESISTRDLASELGLSQPALFRHFRDRDALLLGVVDHARGLLGAIGVAVIEQGGPAPSQLRTFAESVLAETERQPGFQRLLFSALTAGPAPFLDALRQLVTAQTAMVAEIVREGQRRGEVDPELDPAAAATLFIGMLQSLGAAWAIGGEREPLVPQLAPVFALWLRAVGAREAAVAPEAGPEARPEAEPHAERHAEPHAEPHAEVLACGAQACDPGGLPAEPLPETGPLATLDVRPIIARGADPLATILATLARMPPAGVLVIEAPFRPSPLLSLLSRRGHAVTAESLAPKHWLVEVVVGGRPAIEDLRDLEPPEPLERVLAATATLADGAVYLARLPRFPRLLIPQLQARALGHTLLTRADGAVLLRVAKQVS